MSFAKSHARKRSIDVRIENLTSGSGTEGRSAASIDLQEIDDESVALSLLAPTAVCAKGHHLKVNVQVMGAQPAVAFVATGLAREVEKVPQGLRIVFQPLQFDKTEWNRLLAAFKSSSDKVQDLFSSMKG